MSKRGPLSKIEKFYIEQNLELGVDKLSSELDRAKSVVKAYAKKCNPVEHQIQKEPTKISENIFSNKKGSTIMTETGSMLGDEFKQKNIDKKRSNCTTNIR